MTYFSAIGEDVEWKLHGHDGPPHLASALAAHGFEPGDRETLLALDLTSAGVPYAASPSIDVRLVRTGDDLDTYLAVTSRAFGDRTAAAADFTARLFGPEAFTIAFVAYDDGRPAAAGRLDLPPDRSFASLWGGGTDPLLRRRRVYHALVAERARIARDRGYRFLTVDALETSRPILERLGFTAIGTTTPWTFLGARPSPPES